MRTVVDWEESCSGRLAAVPFRMLGEVMLQLFDVLFEELDALAELTDNLVLGIHAVDDIIHYRQIALDSVAVAQHYPARNADDRAICRHILVHDGVRADLTVVSDVDCAHDLGAHADQYAVPDRRVP